MPRQREAPQRPVDELQQVVVTGPPAARLALVDAGPHDGPPLLFIHGVGGYHAQWSAQLPAFAAHYRCLTPSLRGHGPSETTGGPYTMERLTNDITQLLALRGIGGPVDIIAHSYGGLLALDLALQRPALVRKLVLIAIAEEMNFGTFFRLVATWPMPTGILDMLRRRFLADRFYATVRVMQAIMREAVLPWQGWATLEQVAQPVLLLAGQFDVVASPQAVRPLAHRFPCGQLAVIRNARHKVQLQRPAAVNERIKTFLDEPF
ncbi:MAG: alpha/beta hydrolase [Herpetosiphonaceae bacterium]|nr:alpha/beta hydrolase [Herpetosiphonaceae bacterium]